MNLVFFFSILTLDLLEVRLEKKNYSFSMNLSLYYNPCCGFNMLTRVFFYIFLLNIERAS